MGLTRPEADLIQGAGCTHQTSHHHTVHQNTQRMQSLDFRTL